jgi:predicted SnoaL-like aldol condensation-catalyzing enzyme
MSYRHLPRLLAQALNEKRIELFDEFIHPEYNNHNPQVQPGPAGVKAFFRHYLDAFADTKVVIEDVIEEGERISARFTYNGTFTKPSWVIAPTVRQSSCEALISGELRMRSSQNTGTSSICSKCSSR